MTYELWDMRTTNMIAYWGDAGAASTDLAELARAHGQGVLDDFCLIHEDDHEESKLIAEGQEILVAVKRLNAEEHASAAGRRAG